MSDIMSSAGAAGIVASALAYVGKETLLECARLLAFALRVKLQPLASDLRALLKGLR